MSGAGELPQLRSALFVPGHRRDFIGKLAKSGADAAILDLEDAVVPDARRDARECVARTLAARAEGRAEGPVLCVRIQALAQGCLVDDLAAAVSAATTAVMLPKVTGPGEVRAVEAALAQAEARAGLPVGAIRLWPLLETAAAVRCAYEIATASPRVAYTGGSAGANGDLAREIGFRWSARFEETLHLRSRALVDVRAAGVPHPMTGVVTRIDDLAEVERFARQSRALGYAGMMVIHPSHVPIANAVFGPDAEEVAAARRLLAALEAAARRGEGAVAHEGQMVDAAMARVVRELLARAGESGAEQPE